MNFKEIERRFLVNDINFIKSEKSLFIKQGYLKIEPNYVIRIRVVSNRSYITLKRRDSSITCQEFEFSISIDNANYLISNYLIGKTINKIRYIVNYDDMVWEVDEFLDNNKGLIIAEIELTHENQKFTKPDWIEKEISLDDRYLNCNLAIRPFDLW